uniref:Ribosomal protein S20 n=1 Tax=Bornetia secundiflora TaxID=2575637 RepID=A0A4D6WNP6_9FLOR|nr:ribosomal protein S20 [Bornetia secundiflora]
MKKNLSAIKKTQLALRNNSINKIYKSAIKTSIKKYLLTINNKDKFYLDDSLAYLSIVYQKIDKAITKGIIHKNKGARKKSRLAKILKTN